MCLKEVKVIKEAKLDYIFPVSEFHKDVFYTSFWLDGNRNGGGVINYVREDIPCKLVSKHLKEDVEILFIERNFRKSLLDGIYHPQSQPDQYFFES